MLWLSLLFPQFPLEVLAECSVLHTGSVAVIADEKILLADVAAREAGVAPGMRLAAAWARQPQLTVLERRSDLEAATLKRLACWAGGFTPEVCIHGESSLLLEIEGCLRLFGGLDVLLKQILDGLATQGFTLQPWRQVGLHFQCRKHNATVQTNCATWSLSYQLQCLPLVRKLRRGFMLLAYSDLAMCWLCRAQP